MGCSSSLGVIDDASRRMSESLACAEHENSFPMQPPENSKWIRLEDIDEEERGKIIKELCEAAKTGNIALLSRLLATDKGLACINEHMLEDLNELTPLHLSSFSRPEVTRYEPGVNHPDHLSCHLTPPYQAPC